MTSDNSNNYNYNGAGASSENHSIDSVRASSRSSRSIDVHLPSAEFRAALENEIVVALRRQSRFAAPARAFRVAHMRTAAALLIGVLLGVGGGIASAQVQENKQKSELALSIDVQRQVAALKLKLAEATMEETKRAVDVGARSKVSLLLAELDVAILQYGIKRLDIDLDEVRATGVAPRDEVWAPVTGKRDFVKDRITMDAAVAQRRLDVAQLAYTDVERSARAGVTTDIALSEAQAELSQARGALSVLAQKISLRDEFVDQRLDQNLAANKLRLIEMQNDREQLMMKLVVARKRAKNARERQEIGALGVLDVKRAELDELQKEVELAQLKRQLDVLLSQVKKP